MSAYVFQPRGKGYSFRIAVPKDLRGRFRSPTTGKPQLRIVEGLGTDSAAEAQRRAAKRRAHWLQVFERAKKDVPLTLGEIHDEAMEAYRLCLPSLATVADVAMNLFNDEKAGLRHALDHYRRALAADDYSGQQAFIEAIERRKGVQIDPDGDTYATLARALLRASIAAIEGRLRALDGQPSEPPVNLLGAEGIDQTTLRPAKLSRPPLARRVEHGPWALFEQWIKEAKPAVATVNRWRAVFLDLQSRFGQRDISEDEAREWARGLVTAERSADTVASIWLSAARRIYKWAFEQKLANSNPFANIKITVPDKAIVRDKAFTDDEATTILRAARAIDPGKNIYKGAQRWVPWLCAYSGARAGEITQLRVQDIETRGGIHAMRITPEAGSVKTNVYRMVPLHEDLIAQGFLDFVKSRGNGPLFYNPDTKDDDTAADAGSPRRPRAVKTRERLAGWVRTLGVTDKGVRPNHAWRHTFKQIAERCGISERVSDAITGHAPTTAGRGYGRPTVEDMAAALTKFPRYAI